MQGKSLLSREGTSPLSDSKAPLTCTEPSTEAGPRPQETHRSLTLLPGPEPLLLHS